MRVSDDVKSLGLDGEEVAFVPQDGGVVVATATLINPFETTVTVTSFSAYANAGLLSDQFTVDNVDTLNNARLFFSNSNFTLASNQLLSLPSVALTSDDYILIKGFVSVDGSAESPFVLAYAPDSVPEPSSSILFVTGAIGLLGYGWSRCRGNWARRISRAPSRAH
jgi:hypothetical protein